MTVLWQEIVIRTLNMYMPGPAPGTPGNPGCYSTRPGHSWHQTKSCLHHHQGKTEDCEHQQQGSRHCSCHRSITISSIIPLQPKVTGAKTEEWVASALNYKLPHYSFISLSEINEFQFSIDVIDHNFCESSLSLHLALSEPATSNCWRRYNASLQHGLCQQRKIAHFQGINSTI